jgi:hypothetical protein
MYIRRGESEHRKQEGRINVKDGSRSRCGITRQTQQSGTRPSWYRCHS